MARFMIFVDGHVEEEFATLVEAEDVADRWLEEIRHDAASNGAWGDEDRVRIVEVVRDYQVANCGLGSGPEADDYLDLCDVSEGGRELDALRQELDAACDAIHDLQLDHAAAVASERERIRGRIVNVIDSGRPPDPLEFIKIAEPGELLPPDVLRRDNERMRAALLSLHADAQRNGRTLEAETLAAAIYGRRG